MPHFTTTTAAAADAAAGEMVAEVRGRWWERVGVVADGGRSTAPAIDYVYLEDGNVYWIILKFSHGHASI